MTRTGLVGTHTGRLTFIIALLLIAGVAQDVQYGTLSPLVGVMAKETGLTSLEVGWVINAMNIGSAVSIGLSTRMGDIFGHRKVLFVLIAAGLLGSALGALATGFWPLVAGRFLMGVAVAVPLAWGLLRPRATVRQVRLVALALSSTMAIFVPIALVIGGAIVSAGMPWQTVFWVSVLLYAVMLICAMASPETPQSARAAIRLDWFGAVGLGVWVTALLIGVSSGPSEGWTSPLVIGSFVVSAVVLFGWVRQQRRAQEPLVSFRNMDVRQALIGYSGILLISVVGQGVFIVLPALLQTPESSGYGYGLTTVESTYVLLAMIPGIAVGYFWTRWGLNRLGPKAVLVVNGIVSIIAFLGFAFMHDAQWMLWVWVFLYGLATVSCLTVGGALVAAAGRRDNMAVTIGVQSIVQFVGGTLPIAIVVNLMVPGADGFIPHAAIIGVYVGCALAVAVFVTAWIIFAPSRTTDLHAVDATPQTTGGIEMETESTSATRN